VPPLISPTEHPPLAPAPGSDEFSKLAIRLSLAAVLLLAAGLRLFRLDAVPPAINQDEAVHAYDAYCLLHTGKDHHGERWPIFFRAFGDYHPGPFVYLLIPAEALLGLSAFSARLPGALLGVLAVGLLYLLLRPIYGRRVAFFASSLLAVSPWHIHLNRLAFEAGICPTLILLALVVACRAFATAQSSSAWRETSPASGRLAKRSNFVLLILLGILVGLTFWTYHAMRVFVPAFLLAALIIHRKTLVAFPAQSKSAARLSAIFLGLLVGLGPFLWAWAQDSDHVWTRARDVSLLATNERLAQTALQFLRNYAANISPLFLFIRGDASIVQSVPGYGQLHLLTAPLILIGLYRVIVRRQTDRFGLLLVAWLLVAPLPAALAHWQGGHALRSVAALPVYDILAALGLDSLFNAAGRSRTPRRSVRVLAGSVVLALGLNVAYFLFLFFVRYPVAAAERFQSEWRQVIADVAELRPRFDLVLLSPDRTNQLGILFLFWSRMDPRQFLESSHQFEQGPRFERLVLVDGVVFAPSAFLAQLATLPEPPSTILAAERPDVAVPGMPIKRYYFPDGREAVVLYELSAKDLPN